MTTRCHPKINSRNLNDFSRRFNFGTSNVITGRSMMLKGVNSTRNSHDIRRPTPSRGNRNCQRRRSKRNMSNIRGGRRHPVRPSTRMTTGRTRKRARGRTRRHDRRGGLPDNSATGRNTNGRIVSLTDNTGPVLNTKKLISKILRHNSKVLRGTPTLR